MQEDAQIRYENAKIFYEAIKEYLQTILYIEIIHIKDPHCSGSFSLGEKKMNENPSSPKEKKSYIYKILPPLLPRQECYNKRTNYTGW